MNKFEKIQDLRQINLRPVIYGIHWYRTYDQEKKCPAGMVETERQDLRYQSDGSVPVGDRQSGAVFGKENNDSATRLSSALHPHHNSIRYT